MSVYNICNSYVKYSDGVLTVADYAVVKPIKLTYGFSKALFSTSAKAYTMGARDFAHWAIGATNVADGREAFKKRSSTMVTITSKGRLVAPGRISPRSIENKVDGFHDDRSLVTRAGEASAHFAIAGKKIAGLAAGAMYGAGAVSNALDCSATNIVHCASKVLSSTVDIASQVAVQYMCVLTKAATATAHALVTNPGLVQNAMVGAGVAGGFYVATKGYVKAANSDTWTEMVKNGAMSVAGLTMTVAFAALPFMTTESGTSAATVA